MSNRSDEYGKVVTLLRGEALREARGSALEPLPKAPARVDVGSKTPGIGAPDTLAASNSGTSIYGVPVSAVQHCCGRGCKHCQIYWHRLRT